ncbi:MAG: MFS transporter, partial [Puniceicoccaceae bacterium]
GWVQGGIERISTLAGAGAGFTPVLFGGLLGSLYSLLQFAFAPLWGGLSDRFGRRWVLLFTASGVLLSYVLWIFAGSFLLLVLARLLGGVMSGNLSVATAAVADVTTRENRAKGMGLVGVAFGLGFITGPAIGGVAALWVLPGAEGPAGSFGLHPFSAPALVAAVLAAINVVWIATRFRETLPAEKRAAGGWRGLRHPVLSVKEVPPGPVRQVAWVNLLFLFGFSGMEFTLAFLAVERFGFSVGQIAAMLVYVGLVLIATQGGLVRRMVPRHGPVKVNAAGLALVAAGLLVLAWAPAAVWLYAGLTVLGVGAGLATPSLATLASLHATVSGQGRALGLFRSFGSLGRAGGPLVAGFLFWYAGSATAYVLGAAWLLLPLLLGLRVPLPAGESEDVAAD